MPHQNGTHHLASNDQVLTMGPNHELAIHPPDDDLLSWLQVHHFSPAQSVGSRVQRGEVVATLSGPSDKTVKLISPVAGSIVHCWRSGNVFRAPREGLVRIKPAELRPFDPCKIALEIYQSIDRDSEELLAQVRAQSKGIRQRTIGFALAALMLNGIGISSHFTEPGSGALRITVLMTAVGVWVIANQIRQTKARLSRYADAEDIREALCQSVSLNPPTT
jgi:hypothetical protein